MHEESLYAERALHAGASGYIMKQEGTENLVTAIRRILGGKIYVSENMESHLLQSVATGGRGEKPASSLERLSDRELEVFSLIGQGMTTRQIAEKICISIKTVETYRLQIKQKLNLPNGMAVIQRAIQWYERQRISHKPQRIPEG
jgi:DNA-binding NarL/FixJ family response regulator